MKRIISVALAAVVLFTSIHTDVTKVQAGELQEERKNISECVFENSVGGYDGIVMLPSQRYTGSEIKPDIVIKDGDYTLTEDIDYTVSPYFNADNVNPNTTPWDSFEGDYGENCPQVVVYGKGSYKGVKQMIFAILSENQKETEDHLIYSDKAVLAGYDGITIDGYVGAETEVVIPLHIDGKPVQEINENAFAYNPTLEKVDISDNVFRILSGAFFRCGNLKEINLSNQLWGIGDGAFAGCRSLTEITLPSSLEKLGNRVFGGSASLEAIHSESETIYDVDGVLFDRNGGINGHTNELYFFPPAKKTETYRIPDGTQELGIRSFRQAEYVKNVIIPQSVFDVSQGADSAFGGKAEIVGESEAEISKNAINIIFKHNQPTDDILSSKLPFSYTLPAGSTITVKNEEMKEAAEASFTGELRENINIQTATKPSDGFELARNDFTLSKGEEAQLSWRQFPEDTTDNITWESRDEAVAKVDPVLGKITAEGYGKCKITGTDESGHSQDVDVFVYDVCKNHSLMLKVWHGQPHNSVHYEENGPECTIAMDQNFCISVHAEADGYAGAQAVEFRSENEDVASIKASGENGKEALLEIKKPGTTVVTATFDDANSTFTDSMTVHVVKSASDIPKPEDPAGPQEKKDQELQYQKTVRKIYGSKPFSLGVKQKKGDGKLAYASSNKKAATVSNNGRVSIKGTGRTIITVTAKETEKYRKKTVKITLDISPKKQKISIKALGGKKIKVKWKKDAGATGYQVQYSTNRKFKKGVKTITVKKKGTSVKTISRLKKGKTYYVKARSYKSIRIGRKTKKLYGAWSATVKSKKIK